MKFIIFCMLTLGFFGCTRYPSLGPGDCQQQSIRTRTGCKNFAEANGQTYERQNYFYKLCMAEHQADMCLGD